MNNTYDKLIEVLKKDERLVVDGKLAKNKVIELALQFDIELLKLLRSSKELLKAFFQEVDDVVIFDKIKFQSFVSNKQFLPDSFTEYKNKIGLTSDKKYLTDNEEIVLSFPYKDSVLEGGQTKEDAKRDEILWNETLALDEIDLLLKPKVLTNFKKYSKGREAVLDSFNIENNILIKGNNLLSLYSLKEKYQEKIKLIYIDPPYNTEGDNNTFAYNNTFNHSSWLTFMKNRLDISKKLLSEDGVLVVTIDDAEQAYLKVLCDEVFGRENFIGVVVVQSNPRGRTTNTHFATSHEYAMFYAKNIENVSVNFLKLTKEQEKDFDEKDEDGEYRLLPFRRSGGTSTPEERPNSFYPIYYNEKNGDFSLEKKDDYIEILPIDKLGKRRVWRQTRPSFLEAFKRGDMVCKKSNGKHVIYMKDRIKDGRKPKTIWVDSKYDASANGTMLLKGIFSGEKVFSYPKSLYAVKDTVDIITEKGGNDIVLDFFGGSGTTAHAVLELNKEDGGNRKFIICEQMDYIESVTKERIRRITETINDGSFIYMEIAEANQLFIRRIQQSKDTRELLRTWEEMKETAFLSYKVKPEEIDATKKDFEGLSFEDQQRFLISILDKNLLYIPYSEIEDKTYKVSKEDIALNNKFYGRD